MVDILEASGARAPKPGLAATPTSTQSEAQIAAMVGQLEERLKSQPDDAQGWTMLGRSYSVLGRYAEADQAYRKVIALRPTDAQAWADRADAQLPAVELASIAQQVGSFGFEQHQLAGDGQQCTAHCGQFDTPSAPVEQLDVEFAFQGLNLICSCRLAQADGSRSSAEAGMAGNGKKRTQSGR